LTNTGIIQGGNGGAGGLGGLSAGGTNGTAGSAGAGGVGISGASLTITNSGTIAGGLSGDGTTRANAITFTGGTNSLTLQAGSTIIGNVVAFSTADTLALGGTTNSTFNMSLVGSQYQGFGTFAKTGTSTGTLTGGPSASALNWNIQSGTLALGATTQIAAAVPARSRTTTPGTVSC
jgi:hypothetical protein